MADFTTLKTYIQNYVKQNGNAEITGEVLQDVLVAMVEALGDTAINELSVGLSDETTARQNADGALQQNIDAEQAARQDADTALQNLINGITTDIQNGYVYAGVATPTSTPASGKVFYLALTAGTYTNFGDTVVSQGINILKYNGTAWSLDSFLGLDDAPTQGSNNLVKSGGVLNSIIKDGSAFDLSAYNSGTTYADLSAALTALNALPAAYKKGGMSMKFVQTSDNNYIQARLMANAFTTDITKWQVVDDEPTAGSKNLVESGGAWDKYAAAVLQEPIHVEEYGKGIVSDRIIIAKRNLNVGDKIYVNLLSLSGNSFNVRKYSGTSYVGNLIQLNATGLANATVAEAGEYHFIFYKTVSAITSDTSTLYSVDVDVLLNSWNKDEIESIKTNLTTLSTNLGQEITRATGIEQGVAKLQNDTDFYEESTKQEKTGIVDKETPYYVPGLVFVTGETYHIYVKTKTQASSTNSQVGIYFAGQSKIYDCTNAQLYAGVEFDYTVVDDTIFIDGGQLGIRTGEAGILFAVSVTEKVPINKVVKSLEEENLIIKSIKQNGSGTSDSNKNVWMSAVHLEVGKKYHVKAKTTTQASSTSISVGIYINTSPSSTRIFSCTNAELYNGVEFDYIVENTDYGENTPIFGIRPYESGITCNIEVENKDISTLKENIVLQKTVTQTKTGIVDKETPYYVPGLVFVTGETYHIYVKTKTQASSTNSQVGIYFAGQSKIYDCTNAQLYAGVEFDYTVVDDTIFIDGGQLGIRTKEIGIGFDVVITNLIYTTVKDEVIKLEETVDKISNLNDWAGANVVVWGDSITAQGNGDDEECVNAYLYPAYKKLKFDHLYVRGIGGQRFVWNTNGWYTAVGTNGKYLDRYLYDSEGNKLSSVINASSYTQQQVDYIESAKGKEIEVHYGCFSSWDRITSMIPASIRESINLIILCGGSNDFADNKVESEFAEPQWSAENDTDVTWVADQAYYNGGDYNINTFSGAIASCIMKMKIWCPNAVVVIATPWAHFDKTTKKQLINSGGMVFREMCLLEEKIAGYQSIPVIDANGECEVQGYDFADYVVDDTHPNAAGRAMFARPFIGGLTKIFKKV